jgi:Cu+-exporting ATPase
MMTGDNWKTARAIADACGIETVYAEASPQEKADRIRELQARSSPRSKTSFTPSIVAMVGDGINDAPSLASADVAMAIGAGTEIAIEAADFVLMHADLYTTVNAIDISRKTFRQIRHNYVWALGYNSVTLPLAAGMFYPQISVPPWFASVLMACSSISVVLASLSLKKTCAIKHRPMQSIKILKPIALVSSA